MNEKIIWLPGQPARVTHQSGTRYANNRTYKTKTLKNWESRLREEMAPYAPKEPLNGAIRLKATFAYRAAKKSDIGKWKLTRPDTDNSVKTLKDVMTKLGFWIDDSQVAFEICKKIWTDDPGITIEIEELGGRCEDWRLDK